MTTTFFPWSMSLNAFARVPKTLAVPDHEADIGVPGHFFVLRGVEREVAARMGSGHLPDPPSSEVVAAGSTNAEDLHGTVSTVREIRLDRPVSTVGVPDHDGELLRDHPINALASHRRKAGDSARASNEHLAHLLLRERVIARANTSAAPAARRPFVMAFIVAPDRNKSSNNNTLRPVTTVGSTS